MPTIPLTFRTIIFPSSISHNFITALFFVPNPITGVQNWFGLTEKFQVLKICPRKIPKFASGNFFNVAILVRFCPRVLLDGSAVLNFASELLQTASPSEFCLRQVRYLEPPAPKSFNFTFSSLRLENLPPAWKFASGEVLSISPQFCTPAPGHLRRERWTPKGECRITGSKN